MAEQTGPGPAAQSEARALKRAMRHCEACETTEKEAGRIFQACGQCKVVRYCSVECQKSDWRQHKIRCNKHVASEATLASMTSNPDINARLGRINEQLRDFLSNFRPVLSTIALHATNTITEVAKKQKGEFFVPDEYVLVELEHNFDTSAPGKRAFTLKRVSIEKVAGNKSFEQQRDQIAVPKWKNNAAYPCCSVSLLAVSCMFIMRVAHYGLAVADVPSARQTQDWYLLLEQAMKHGVDAMTSTSG